MSLKVKRFLTSVNAANCYIAWCDETNHGVVVDPAEFTEEMQSFIRSERVAIQAILITHGHYDHDSGLDDLLAVYDVPVYAGKEYPHGTMVGEGDIIRIGSSILRVVPTTGHTDDSVSFINSFIAFVGDAIFAAAVGGTTSRQKFQEETAGIEEYLFHLPDPCKLYPGHGPVSSVSVEKTYNPFFH